MQCNVSAQSEFAQPLVLINFGMNLAQRHRITLQVKKKRSCGLFKYVETQHAYRKTLGKVKTLASEAFSCISQDKFCNY